MKTNYTYNVQRDTDGYSPYSNRIKTEPSIINPLTKITETRYSEIGRLKEQNSKLQQQLSVQKELIESAHTLITKYAWLLLPICNPTSFDESKDFEEKLKQYKEKYP